MEVTGVSHRKVVTAPRGINGWTDLGAWTPSSFDMTAQGSYTDYTVTSDITLPTSIANKVKGVTQVVTVTFDGTNTLSKGGFTIYNNSFTDGGTIASGTYDLWFIYTDKLRVNLITV